MTQPNVFTKEQVYQLYMWLSENPLRRALDFKNNEVFAYDATLVVGKYIKPDSDIKTLLDSFPEIALERKRKELEKLQNELGSTTS